MLMKLRNFHEALAMFERVLIINPLLAEGALEGSMQICRAALATNASSTPANSDGAAENQEV
jgi:hypothetical protein